MAEGSPVQAAEGATQNVFTSKLGPLPVWAWAAGIVGVVLVWSRMRGGGASASPPVAAPAGSQAPGGSPTLGGTPVYVYSDPSQNAQTAGGPSFPQGLLGAAPTGPLAVGTSGQGTTTTSSSATGINAPQGSSGTNSGTASVKSKTGLLKTPGLANQNPDVLTVLDPGAQATITGPAVTGYWGGQTYVALPVLYYGESGFINAADVTSATGGASGMGSGAGPRGGMIWGGRGGRQNVRSVGMIGGGGGSGGGAARKLGSGAGPVSIVKGR